MNISQTLKQETGNLSAKQAIFKEKAMTSWQSLRKMDCKLDKNLMSL